MLFNSFSFAIFLPIVFYLYWFTTKGNLRLQNILLLVSSLFFYASWDWRFLYLLVFSIIVDYYAGAKLSDSASQHWKKIWLWSCIIVKIGILGVFKYYNFFTQSFASALDAIGLHVNPWTLKLILPLGISFYSFHGISYVIDIYNGKIKAEKNFVNYSVFVSFFPLLVAGPIERATHLLPQIQNYRTFDYAKAVDGLRQILWGLFKKVVIADQCAEYANQIFNQSADHSGSTLVVGAIFFTFQIYADFSGYSDIALGTARLFGLELLRNFAFPYFSRDIAEFWRRWHISLSSWFKDYLYIPLGGSRGGMWMRIRNTFIIFLVSGLWHGANWTFIVWGFLNALFILPSIIFNTNRNNLEIVAKGRKLPYLKELIAMVLTFSLTVFAWIFFRAENIGHAIAFISGIFSKSLFSIPTITPYFLFILILIFMTIEWLGREENYAIANLGLKWKRPIRYGMYYAMIIAILWFGGKEQEFIYFQF